MKRSTFAACATTLSDQAHDVGALPRCWKSITGTRKPTA